MIWQTRPDGPMGPPPGDMAGYRTGWTNGTTSVIWDQDRMDQWDHLRYGRTRRRDQWDHLPVIWTRTRRTDGTTLRGDNKIRTGWTNGTTSQVRYGRTRTRRTDGLIPKGDMGPGPDGPMGPPPGEYGRTRTRRTDGTISR